ncbi:MAG: DUF2125 domain-containing protein [Pseudomonadota bacterium]
MRFILRLAVVLVVLWCGWWALASWGLHRGLTQAIATREGDGWRADVQQAGFPLRLRSELRDIVLTGPTPDLRVTAEQLAISAPTYWPGFITADLPEAPVRISTPAGEVILELSEGDAGLDVSPGMALELAHLRLRSGTWRLRLQDQALFSGDAIALQVNADAQSAARYLADFSAENLSLGDSLRAALALPADWPEAFDRFTADLAVIFDKPLDRFAGEQPSPQPRRLALNGLDLAWGEIALSAKGALDIDATGVPEGRIEVQLKNWRTVLDLAQNAGALPDQARRQANFMLGALASRAGAPEDLDLTLNFTSGRLALSGIDLGPAPRIGN